MFAYLEQLIPEEVDTQTGHLGMARWDILLLGSLQVNLNCDCHRVMELANEHRTLRQRRGNRAFYGAR